MNISVREITENDIELIVDYFINSSVEFLIGMGADKSKLPKKSDWIKKLKSEFKKPYREKEFYYIIWLIDGLAIGHTNINKIEFGKFATMHLHLWEPIKRKSGLGTELIKMSIPYYFENFKLKKLICEPYAENIAPNKTLPKLGFEFKRAYETTPGYINFRQTVNRYELTKEHLNIDS